MLLLSAAFSLSLHSAMNHAHGECLFAACMAAFEAMVQIKGYTGQVAQIFQQRKQREENSHGG